jgi:PPOX class probable F420-dependent enzyme
MTSIPDSHRDLLDASVATLATVGPDGRPQQTVVWFIADGDTIKISLNTARQKTKNLKANPVVDLLILDVNNTQRYLEVRGDATIESDNDYKFADAFIQPKYGLDPRIIDQPGEERVVVTINPVRIHAIDMDA